MVLKGRIYFSIHFVCVCEDTSLLPYTYHSHMSALVQQQACITNLGLFSARDQTQAGIAGSRVIRGHVGK